MQISPCNETMRVIQIQSSSHPLSIDKKMSPSVLREVHAEVRCCWCDTNEVQPGLPGCLHGVLGPRIRCQSLPGDEQGRQALHREMETVKLQLNISPSKLLYCFAVNYIQAEEIMINVETFFVKVSVILNYL